MDNLGLFHTESAGKTQLAAKIQESFIQAWELGAGRGQGCTPPQAWESGKKEDQLSLPTLQPGMGVPREVRCPSQHWLLLSGPAVVKPESAPRDHAVRVAGGSLRGGGVKLGNEEGYGPS